MLECINYRKAIEKMAEKLSFMNIEESTARAMCYVPVFGILCSLVFLVLESNKKVKWDGLQSLVIWILVMAAGYLLNISIVLRWLVPLLNLMGVIVIPLLLAVKASQKEDTRMIFAGDIVDRIIKQVIIR